MLIGVPARAETLAALMARAPRPAIDGKQAPLTAPLDVGGTGWGPFSRLCVARVIVRPDGGETPAAEPSCLVVERAHAQAGTWHLSLRLESTGGRPDVTFTATRDADGAVTLGDVAIAASQPPLAPAMQDRIRTLLRQMLEVHGLRRTTIVPGEDFLLPLPPGTDADMRMRNNGFICRAEGTGRRGGRPVLLARCTAQGTGEVEPGRGMSLDMAGRFAIDVATGLVLGYGYASHSVLEGDPKRGTRPLRLRGAARQSLS